QATSHLISKGYTRIAHIAGPKELAFTQERWRGYRQALSEAKIPYREDYIIFSGFGQSNGFHDTNTLLALPQPPNAIFAVNDRKVLGAIPALTQSCYLVRQDFGVICFTNVLIATVI